MLTRAARSIASQVRLKKPKPAFFQSPTWRFIPSRAPPVQVCRRDIHIETFLLPPVVFFGLLGSLWLWKCAMMVVFQNKIIYMPGMPPNARMEKIEDYAGQCGGTGWEEKRIRAADSTDLSLCVATLASSGGHESTSSNVHGADAPVYILYFQGRLFPTASPNHSLQLKTGNASSLPPRLPDLSRVLRMLRDGKVGARYTMACLSYRGYWTSRGRPSERGINLDAQAALRWVEQSHATSQDEKSRNGGKPLLFLWGQSIGAGVVTNLAASNAAKESLQPTALILETPFLSIRAMLEHLYPQKWLPYRHLWPFLRNHLDSWGNLGIIATKSKAAKLPPPRIFILEAGRDELVPPEHGAKLYERCVQLGVPVEKKTVGGAYHSEAIMRGQGKTAVVEAIEAEVKRALSQCDT
jgi:uncharacterized protein